MGLAQRQQGREVARRATRREHAVGALTEADGVAHEAHQGALHGDLERPHLEHGRAVVGQRRDELEQRGLGQRRGDLVSDVARVVQVVDSLQRARSERRQRGGLG